MAAVKVGRFVSGSATQTVSGVGFRPKCVILWHTYQSNEETFENDLQAGIGAATATGEQWASAIWDRHNQGTSDCFRRMENDICVLAVSDPGTGRQIDMEGAFAGFTSDGFQITWSVSASVDISYIAIGGSANAYAGVHLIDDAGGTPSITGVGFQPSCILAHGIHLGSLDAYSDHGFYSFGGGSSASATDQATCSIAIEDDVTTTDTYRKFRQGEFLEVLTLAGGSQCNINLDSFDADGYTWSVSSSFTADRYMGYVALGNVSAFGGYDTQPVSTGDQAITGAGFTPNLLFTWSHGHGNSGTVQDNAVFQIGATDGTNETTHIITSLDNQGTSDSDRAQSDTDVLWRNASNVGNHKSFDADGFTINWTACDGGERYYGYLALLVSEATGWGHNINGVANANIGKINGIPKANIAKVNAA